MMQIHERHPQIEPLSWRSETVLVSDVVATAGAAPAETALRAAETAQAAGGWSLGCLLAGGVLAIGLLALVVVLTIWSDGRSMESD